MSNYCIACERLRQDNPDFVLNGVTDEICKNLRKNRGLNKALADFHEQSEELDDIKNCGDLHDIVDCLIGNLGETLPAYDLCDMKEYMAKLMTNLYNTQKAMVCSECGQWDAIESILKGKFTELTAGRHFKWNKHNNLTNETNITLSVFETNDRYYFRVGGDLFHNNLKELIQEHNYGLPARPKSLLITIDFLNEYAWINTMPQNIVDFNDNGYGIFNTTPKVYRCSWQANYNMAVNFTEPVDNENHLVNIFWRSYNDGYNDQIATNYPDVTIALAPGLMNYEFTVMKP